MRKILLIEDDLNVRETIFEILSYNQYVVKAVNNGQEALELLENWTPHLMLCDIMMPVMDGHAFHEAIQKNKSLSGIPFIFLTAKTEENLARKCLNEGADDFLSKPFKANELLEIIRTKIDRFEKIKNAHFNLYKGKKKYFVHEINTPLHGILCIANILTGHLDSRLNEQDKMMLYKGLKVSGDRLNRTMQNLFLYQELIDNNLVFKLESSCETAIAIQYVIDKLIINYENLEQRIEFVLKPCSLNIEQKYLQFILYELLDNALKFSKDEQVSISGNPLNDEFYEFIIRDKGIGFSNDQLKNITSGIQFNREKLEQQGLGLGLALSKKFIEKSKGIMIIESKEQKGTTITFKIPIF